VAFFATQAHCKQWIVIFVTINHRFHPSGNIAGVIVFDTIFLPVKFNVTLKSSP